MRIAVLLRKQHAEVGDGSCERALTKPRGIDKTPVDASPCLERVCSGAVFFEDVPPACPLNRVSVKKTGAVREL